MKSQPIRPTEMTLLIEASRPKSRIISNYVVKSKSSIGAKHKLGPPIPRKTMNWFHPLLWVQIETACRAVGWPFSPIVIKGHLMRTNQEQFEALHPQRLSEWIDKSDHSGLHFTKSVQQRIAAQAMEPGGHNSRIGILVGELCVHQGLSDHVPRRNILPLWS